MASKPKRAKAKADQTEEEEGASARPKRKLSVMLIMIAAGTLVALGGGGTAGYLMLGFANDAKSAATPVKPAVFFDVPEMLVNLSTSGGDRTQYLKFQIVLELPDATLTPQIRMTMPRVTDAFQTYLRELRPTDLDSSFGYAGFYRLKQELTRQINAAIAPNRINTVLFKQMILQ
jgi:flagellar FliL protein